MIEIKNFKVKVKEKEILKWINLEFELWKNYCLLWKNWSWKSTLSSVLMGDSNYEIIEWNIKITSDENSPFIEEGVDTKKNLLKMSPEERSKAWIFLSFQNVPEIPWVRLVEFLRIIYNTHLKIKNPEVRELSPFIFKRFIKKYLEELHIDENFLDRDLNVGFSGWEKRKIEILQMKLIEPKYIILDEIDSGLDLDAFRKVAELLKSVSSEKNSIIIITHYFKILEYMEIDKVYVMKNWLIEKSGDKSLAEYISKNGFENFVK